MLSVPVNVSFQELSRKLEEEFEELTKGKIIDEKTGELHARSWIVFGDSGTQQDSRPSPIVAGTPQSTPASMQAH